MDPCLPMDLAEMPSERVLSQEEIDSFRRQSHPHDDAALKAQAYDFRRPDRMAKDQFRAIHLLHESFARSLASSLSAFLRAYVAVNLVSVEQLAFTEFAQTLPSPTSIVALGMKPYDGSAVLELNPSLVFPVLEMLLGGSGTSNAKVDREITEIEQSILDGLLRIILNDLRAAWKLVADIDFSIESHETEPQLLQILAPNEAVVAISMEIRLGEISGIMNLGIPSITLKMLRHKFDQQWSARRSHSSEEEHARVLRLIQPALLDVEAALRGPKMSVEKLLALKEGDVLAFDFPLDRPMELLVNGKARYRGEIVGSGRKQAFETLELVTHQH
ncbi:MAG: flagellar motor switch protein FliM [Acidobacteriota bacterium]